MKKIIIAAIALALVACSKAPATQEVVFHTNLIETGGLTRSSDHGEILSLIESTYPTITPKIWYSDDERVNITLGEPMTVKLGTWLFSWESPTITHMTDVMYDCYLALKPYMDIDTHLTITAGVTDYILPVNYNSVAFVWDTRETSNIYHNGKNGNLPQTKCGFGVYSENYGVFFLNGSLYGSDSDILILQLRPQDTENGKVTNYYFSNRMTEFNGHTTYPLTAGHYYVLHPDSITEIDGATFSIGFPDWVCDMD